MKGFAKLHNLDGEMILARPECIMMVHPANVNGAAGCGLVPARIVTTTVGALVVKETMEQIEAILEDSPSYT